MTRHRFRPRYRGIAFTSIGIGGSLAVVSSVVGFVALPLVTGVLGLAAGAAYLASPTWRLAVVVDDDGLEVSSPTRTRFRIAWNEIVKVVASPSTSSCFVDGGSPAKSLLVPGVGAPAPYDLEDRPALFATILAHVPAEKVETVDTLEQAIARAKAEDQAKADQAKADKAKVKG
jgi:hypothetical protein